MKTFIATISMTAFAFLTGFAQEMPADLKAKLDAKALEVIQNNESKAKAWVSQQKTAWETIQCMAFSVGEDDVKLIKSIADKKHPLDYVSQEAFITEQAGLASALPEYKAQLGASTYNAIRKSFEATNPTNIGVLVELMQKATTAKMEIDSITSDKVRPRTLAIIKKVVAEEYPGNFAEQLKTIKEILEGKSAEATADTNANQPEKRITNRELEKMTREMFANQTYLTDGEKRAIAILTEIQGKKVMLIPASAYVPGTTLSNVRGEQLEYNENEVYSSKEYPFVIVFPKNIPENYFPAKFITNKQYKELPGQTKFIVGYIKQNVMAYPVRINSVTSTQVVLTTFLPPNMAEGSMIVDPQTKETLSFIVANPVKLRKINWMDRNQVNRLVRYIEAETGKLCAIRIDDFSKWEKFTDEKYYEQKVVLDRLKLVTNELLKLFTSSQLSDSESSQVVGQIVKKHYNGFKSKMERSSFERKYKAFIVDMCNLIKAEQRKASDVDFYAIFKEDIRINMEILNQMLNTYEKATKSQAFLNMLQEDLKRLQDM